MEKELIKVQVNGQEIIIPKGSSVNYILNKINLKVIGSFVAINELAPEKEVEKVTQYEFITNKGSLYVEVDKRVLNFIDNIFSISGKIKNIWSNPRSIGFGYLNLKFKPTKISFECNRGDVLLSFLGFEQDKACIVFSKDKHSSCYGSPQEIPILGKVIKGRHLLHLLGKEDYVREIKPVLPKTIMKRVDTKYQVLDPSKILTTLELDLSKGSTIGSELVLALFQKQKFFQASEVTSVYVKDTYYSGISILGTFKLQQREKGTATVRVEGNDKSSLYLYKKKILPSKHHLYVGDIISGIELIEVAENGDRIPTKVNPERTNVIGLTQKEAEIQLNKMRIKQIRKREIDDGAIIVKQEPYYTLEAYKKGVVETFGNEKSDILKIKLYDNISPVSVRYFRINTGLIYDKIGKLTIHFITPDFLVFKEKCSIDKPLIPENIPKKKVEEFEIGISNMSSRFMGLIGIRNKPSEKYGSSGEKFVATNIIGKLLSSKEFDKFKEGDTMYFSEFL